MPVADFPKPFTGESVVLTLQPAKTEKDYTGNCLSKLHHPAHIIGSVNRPLFTGKHFQ